MAQHSRITLPPLGAAKVPGFNGDETDQPSSAPSSQLAHKHAAPSPTSSPTAEDQVLPGRPAPPPAAAAAQAATMAQEVPPPAAAAAEAAPTAQEAASPAAAAAAAVAGSAHATPAPAAATAAKEPEAAKPPSLHAVLFNAPNSVCWLRLLLMVAGIQQAAVGQANKAFCLFVISMALDAVDGWLARRLNQATSFGALLDVVLDIWLRGWLWVNALPTSVALIPPLLEMMVFTVTHKTSGADWKASCFDSAPPWVSAVMAGGGFKSPAGMLAIAGLMGCPLWLWAMRHLPGPTLLTSPAWGLVLVPGRILAAAVEVWVVWWYLVLLLQQDAHAAATVAAAAAARKSD